MLQFDHREKSRPAGKKKTFVLIHSAGLGHVLTAAKTASGSFRVCGTVKIGYRLVAAYLYGLVAACLYGLVAWGLNWICFRVVGLPYWAL
jgi:hypothetical protein